MKTHEENPDYQYSFVVEPLEHLALSTVEKEIILF